MARLTVNLSDDDPFKAVVESFFSPSPVSGMPFMRESDKYFEAVFVEDANDPSGEILFNYLDPTGWDIFMGAGVIGLKPTAGTFTLTDPTAAQTTDPIQWNAAAADVSAAINARLTTNWSNAVVTGDPGGPYTITNAGTGDKTTPTATATALQPAKSSVDLSDTQEGTADQPEQFFVELVRALPIGKSSLWDSLPAAAASCPVQTAGSGTQNKVFKLTWNADAYGGDSQPRFTGDTTTQTLAPIPFDATEEEVYAIFRAHPDVDDQGVAVRKIRAGLYFITCQGGGIALSDTPAMSIVSQTLQVPPGISGILNANTAGCTLLLNGAASVPITFEIRINRGAGWQVVAQLDATLYANLIRGTNGVADAIDPTPTMFDVPLRLRGVTGYTGGGATNADGQNLKRFQFGQAVWFFHTVDGLVVFEVVNSTDATSAPGTIRGADYADPANTRVLKKRE